VVIVAIDEATIQEAGGFPLPRGMVARIVRELAKHEPQAVALDMLFVDAKPEGDAESQRCIARDAVSGGGGRRIR
jgi:adenylate cyclase